MLYREIEEDRKAAVSSDAKRVMKAIWGMHMNDWCRFSSISWRLEMARTSAKCEEAIKLLDKYISKYKVYE